MLNYIRIKVKSVYYGWWIVAACFLNYLLLAGFVALGFTAFFEPIATEFGWSYTQISFASSLRGIEAGLIAPLAGILVDRWGPRVMVLTGIIVIGCGLLFMSRIESLYMFYLGFIIIALGQSGTSPTVVMTTLANWFNKKLGLATGILGSGFAFGGLMVPLVASIIDTSDWRTAYLILGIIILAVGLPVSLIIRSNPEQYGYLPDGAKSPKTGIDSPGKAIKPKMLAGFGVKQALTSRAFWHIGIAMALQFMTISTVVIHVMPYLSSVGIPRTLASLVAMVVPLASIAGRLSTGWLCDKFGHKRTSILYFLLMLAGMICINQISDKAIWMIVPFVLLFGAGWGGNNTVRVVLMNNYFGRRKFGSIFGIFMGMSMLCGIIGPLFAGWIFDHYASYRITWTSLGFILMAGLVIIATLPKSSSDSATESPT